MRYRTGLFLFILWGVLVGLFMLYVHRTWTPFYIFSLMAISVIGRFVMLFLRRKQKKSAYDVAAQELFARIHQDIHEVHQYTGNIENWQFRQQLKLICEDIEILMEKVSEKAPESRLSAGQFVRGYLDFLIHDILPQYIEMQNMPRYYDSSDDKMKQAHQAIQTLGTFLHKRIVALELADDMRYAVAIEMLKSLNAYTHGDAVHTTR